MPEPTFEGGKQEQEGAPYELESNQDFLGFEEVTVTETDDSLPWKPPVKVDVKKAGGEMAKGLDANTPFFTFRDSDGGELTISAAAAGHVDSLHIKGDDPGSLFDYPSLEAVLQDAAQKLPEGVAKEEGVSAFSVDMGKKMGQEGIASMAELKEEGIIEDGDVEAAEAVRAEVSKLNLEGSDADKKAFVEKFAADNPDSEIQFQLVRDKVIVPTVADLKRDTTELFMVFGPGKNDKGEDVKTMYTMAPGRNMPKHPDVGQHTDRETGKVDEAGFKESSDAWFDTVMLIEREVKKRPDTFDKEIMKVVVPAVQKELDKQLPGSEVMWHGDTSKHAIFIKASREMNEKEMDKFKKATNLALGKQGYSLGSTLTRTDDGYPGGGGGFGNVEDGSWCYEYGVKKENK